MIPATTKPNEVIRLSMDTVQGFEALQRAANLLAASSIVPETYRRWQVDKDGNRSENPNGLANCVVALNMSARMGADPILIMQNLHVIEGRPSWSSLFVIASINQCGRFSPLRFDLSQAGNETDVEYSYVEWSGPKGNRQKSEKKGKIKVRPQTCRAWAIEKETGQRLEGPEVSIQMAIDEGWIQKNGSKWRTMPEVMLRYRAASFFGKLYAPELLMGLQSREEMEDIIDADVIDAETREITRVKTKAKNVTPSQMPKALGDWTVEQLDELEGLIEEAYRLIKDAGYKDEADQFEASIRAKRSKANPEQMLAEIREQVASLKTTKPTEHVETPKDAPEDGTLFNADEQLF